MKIIRRATLVAAMTVAVLAAAASAASAGPLTGTYSYTAGAPGSRCTAAVYLYSPNGGAINAGAGGSCEPNIPALPRLYLTISRNGAQVYNSGSLAMPWNGSRYGTLVAPGGVWWWGSRGTRWQACALVTNSNGVWIAGGCTPVWTAP